MPRPARAAGRVLSVRRHEAARDACGPDPGTRVRMMVEYDCVVKTQ